MKVKKTFYTEAAYFVGIILLALGTALMEKADYGMSMVVAPAYLVYLKVSQVLPWFTFGMAEYCLQAVLIVLICVIMKRFRKMYLFSFVTAVFYGIVLDLMISAAGIISAETTAVRMVLFSGGLLLCACGVAMLFHTYIAPEAYELFVKEISAEYGMEISRFKTVYDCCSCLIAVLLSFLFFGFGHFEGVKAGTIFTAFVNGWLIGRCSAFLESRFTFRDGMPLRKYFE